MSLSFDEIELKKRLIPAMGRLCGECRKIVPKCIDAQFADDDALKTAMEVETAARGHLQCVKAIVNWNLDPEMEDGIAISNHTGSSLYPSEELLGEYIDYSYHGPTPVVVAAANGHPEVLEFLLQKGYEYTEVRVAETNNPLVEAVKNDNKECFDILLSKFQIEFKNWSCLLIHAAICHSSEQTVDMLIKAGADVEENTCMISKDETFLMMLRADDVGIAKLLISAGVDVNHQNRDGDTALILSVHMPKCMRVLIEAGADVNATNQQLRSPLMDLVGNGELYYALGKAVQCVSILLRAGAKINLMDSERRNALSLHLILPKEDLHKNLALLLYAAGEKVQRGIIKEKGSRVPKYLKLLHHSLMDICRRWIREHLLELDPHTHLFGRVPRLEIPISLHNYLLYDQTLANSEKLI